MGKTYDRIAAKCEELGITVGELSRRANVDRSVLHSWKVKEPKTLQTWRKIKATLRRLQAIDKPTAPPDQDEPMPPIDEPKNP